MQSSGSAAEQLPSALVLAPLVSPSVKTTAHTRHAVLLYVMTFAGGVMDSVVASMHWSLSTALMALARGTLAVTPTLRSQPSIGLSMALAALAVREVS
jgi:hypothetical protein